MHQHDPNLHLARPSDDYCVKFKASESEVAERGLEHLQNVMSVFNYTLSNMYYKN